jgi:hypothetical protein
VLPYGHRKSLPTVETLVLRRPWLIPPLTLWPKSEDLDKGLLDSGERKKQIQLMPRYDNIFDLPG